MINVDGSGLTDLSNPMNLEIPEHQNDKEPQWSKDGSQIYFVAHDPLDHQTIHVMDIEGGNRTRLTTQNATGYEFEEDLTVSPDGSKIAFVRHSEIFVMNADGSNQTNLTNQLAALIISRNGHRTAKR